MYTILYVVAVYLINNNNNNNNYNNNNNNNNNNNIRWVNDKGNQRGEIVEGNNNNKYVYDIVVLNCVYSLFTPKYDNHCYCKKLTFMIIITIIMY